MKLARLLSMALVAVCASQAPAYAQLNWKLASAAQPGSPLIGFVDEAATKITAGSKGAIKVERLFIGSEQEIVQQIVRGRLEMVSVSLAGTAPIVPEAGLMTTPYIWRLSLIHI